MQTNAAAHLRSLDPKPPADAPAIGGREKDVRKEAWLGLVPGRWSRAIDVRDFIQRNVTSYPGDESFLAEPSERTKAVWAKLQPYFREEIKKGVLDADPK